MRALSPLEEQTIAVSRAHMLVLKISGANAGRGEQPVLRGHVFSTPQEKVPELVVLKAAAAFRAAVEAARADRRAVLATCTDQSAHEALEADVAKMTAYLDDKKSVSLPHLDLLGRISILFVGPNKQWMARRALLLPCGSIAVIDFDLLCRIIAILSACQTEGYEHAFADVLGTGKAFYSGRADEPGSFQHGLVEAAVVSDGAGVCALDALTLSMDKGAVLPQANADLGDGEPSIGADAPIVWQESQYGLHGSAPDTSDSAFMTDVMGLFEAQGLETDPAAGDTSAGAAGVQAQ
jgi:hypothetical protein